MFITAHQKTKQKFGFTLVEILVVLSIIGVLAGLLLTNFVGVRGRAADAKRKSDLRQLKTALRLYYNDFQSYPADTQSQGIAGCGEEGITECTNAFETTNDEYMKQLPAEFSYYSNGIDEYLLVVELENLSDEALANSVEKCDPESRTYFGQPLEDNFYFECED